MARRPTNRSNIPRRQFIHGSAAALFATAVLDRPGRPASHLSGNSGPAQHELSLDRGWLFGGRANAAASHSVTRITLPHTVAPLSWKDWNPSEWQEFWTYQRNFQIPPAFRGKRTFLHFDRVMAAAAPVLNGIALPQHLGGFLPFEYEITNLVNDSDNRLAVAVDARWLNVPPSGAPQGPGSIDYLLPGGITGSVFLYAVPAVFIQEVFATPTDVLGESRRLDVLCTLNGDTSAAGPFTLRAELSDGELIIARTTQVAATSTGGPVRLTLDRLGNISLWDTDAPHLYDLTVTLSLTGRPLHRFHTRVGLRDARFETNGFFLNGRRLQLFGLNRHELYPYVGFAASPRTLRRDAELLRRTFNCNMVRCSHYPQSTAFLDACDELGLMVWEEIPGWQYIGNSAWQNLALRDTEAMIRRDRNHPAIVIWGVRINESANNPQLYQRTRALAKSLDPLRPSSGTMTTSSMQTWREQWHEDVLAFDDYHASGPNNVDIGPPPPNVPYLVAEAVGQFNYATGKGFTSQYRRAGDVALQARQAVLHAQAHDRAAANPQCAGVIAWCAFDYASLINSYDGIKCPGIADVFRIPKLGASFYKAQVDPSVRPVIEPSFYWDFGPRNPSGPGNAAAIFSNCERLDVFLGEQEHATLEPDRSGFPHLRYPPFFVDLTVDGSRQPDLRIEGYVQEKLLIVRRFCADRAADRLGLHLDDQQLRADGADSTRLALGVVDRFGSPRLFAEGNVTLVVDGPAPSSATIPSVLTKVEAAAPYGSEPSPAAPVWSASRQLIRHSPPKPHSSTFFSSDGAGYRRATSHHLHLNARNTVRIAPIRGSVDWRHLVWRELIPDKQPFVVHAIEDNGGEKRYWHEIGVDFRNADGSLNLKLYMQPLLKLQIRARNQKKDPRQEVLSVLDFAAIKQIRITKFCLRYGVPLTFG